MSAITFDGAKVGVSEQSLSGDPNIRPSRFERVWNTLTSYVQPNSTLSLDNAIDSVTQCWDHTSKYPVAIWKAPIRIAEQIPYHHPSHKKLADFMSALIRSEKLLSKSKADSHEDAQRILWAEFISYLGDDDFISPSERFKDIEEREDPIIYANYCAFLANLVEPEWSSQWFVWDMARWNLDSAFEVDAAAATPVRDFWVIGAAQFIVFQVPTIFDEVKKDRNYGAEIKKVESCFSRWGFAKRRRRRQQQQHDSQLTFTWDRWQVWKHAFSATVNDETYGKECRAVARQATDLMALQEKIEDNHPKEA